MASKKDFTTANTGRVYSSIAEATAALTGIFEAAQKTAEAYLEHVRAAYPPPADEKKAESA